jgi:hypothetical protein
MKKIIVLVALALALTFVTAGGVATVMTLHPQPAVACGGSNC